MVLLNHDLFHTIVLCLNFDKRKASVTINENTIQDCEGLFTNTIQYINPSPCSSSDFKLFLLTRNLIQK